MKLKILHWLTCLAVSKFSSHSAAGFVHYTKKNDYFELHISLKGVQYVCVCVCVCVYVFCDRKSVGVSVTKMFGTT